MRIERKSLVLLPLVMTLHCSAEDPIESTPEDDETQDGDPRPVTWEPGDEVETCDVDALLPPYAYGAKVKTLLTGYPLNEQELKSLDESPEALESMIAGWLALPEATSVLERFFMVAFQQTNADSASLFNLFGRGPTGTGLFTGPTSPRADEMLNASFTESFARTAARIVEEGRPFSDVLTTDELVLTTAEMALLAYVDDEVVADDKTRSSRTSLHHFDRIKLVRDAASAPPLAQALDPANAKFGTFWHAGLAALPAECNVVATQTIDTTQVVTGQWRLNGNITPAFFVFSELVLGRHQPVSKAGNAACNTGAANKTPLLTREDYRDYRVVKIRQPEGDESPTLFYNVDAMRGATELVLHGEQSGFLTSPGFLSSWVTNEDNAARVTINQALIVALGKSFEGDAVSDFTSDGIDSEHADPQSECYGCHQTLDPMTRFYQASLTHFYNQQLEPDRQSLTGEFVFRGVEEEGNGVRALGEILASHPDFPYAWAQKLCYYANSEACPEGAELDRIVKEFKASDLDFRVLIAELFSSPLVTGSACIAGTSSGTTASIARRSTFCNQLSTRLGSEDMCGIRTHFRDGTPLMNGLRDAVTSVPDDSFSRAVIEPVVISQTSMFTRANTEAACVQAAQHGAFPTEGVSTDDATLTLVEMLMGLPPSDPRHDGALEILRDHVAEAREAGKTDAEAIQAAFVLACMSPSVAGVGF